jgi:hypothetical protein
MFATEKLTLENGPIGLTVFVKIAIPIFFSVGLTAKIVRILSRSML